MREFYTRWILSLCAFGLAFGFILQVGCSPAPTVTCKTNNDCKDSEVCNPATQKCEAKADQEITEEKIPVDGGGDEKVTPPPDNDKVVDQNIVDQNIVPEKTVVDDNNAVCPPGCVNDKCTGGSQTKDISLGSSCKVETGQPDPCAKVGFTCVANGINNNAYCYKTCTSDADCQSFPGQKCVERGTKDVHPKICGVLNTDTDGEICNYSRQTFCADGYVCLVSEEGPTAGQCFKSCTNDLQCTGGKVCRKVSEGSTNTFCMDPILPGPRCVGQTCSSASTNTNCMEGLYCDEGMCLHKCDKQNGDADCDTAKGETCVKFPFDPRPGLCLTPPSVFKAGEECDGLRRCDDTKGLRCVAITEDKSICIKTCDTNKGAENNPDCPSADFLCNKPQNMSVGLCQKKGKFGDMCGGDTTCAEKPSACIRLTETDAYCLKLCATAENKSKEDETNPACDGGKGRCIQLSGTIDVDGKGYNGACLPYREKKLAAGEACGMDQGLNAPDCKEGTRCVGLSGLPAPICFVDCDPCDSISKDGDWLHPACNGGKDSCIPLQYSDGKPAGGICLVAGEPVLDLGEFCGSDMKKGCKDELMCVRFSNQEGAQSVCSKKCDPGKGTSTNAECNGGQCGSLTSGGGVCIPEPRRTRKLGEECGGDIGMVGFDDCLEEQGGKKLMCAQSSLPGLPRTCLVGCNTIKGFKDNDDCKNYGLTNHLCLPGDNRSPDRGACIEICTFTNRLRCETSKCEHGKCQESMLDQQRGKCLTEQDEKKCQDKGGTCIKQTCVANLCL
jgi:hypothetical protein